jgi:hypothetical protein
MRHYYDIYGLLQRPEVKTFIGTDPYKAPKEARFRQGDNQNIARNEAFNLSDAKIRAQYADAYQRSSGLYCASPLSFEEVLGAIKKCSKNSERGAIA